MITLEQFWNTKECRIGRMRGY